MGVKNRYSLLSSRQPTRQFIQYLKTRFLPPPPPPPNSTPPRARISRHPDGFCVQNPARPRAEKVEFASELQLEANDWRVLFCDYRKTFTKSGKQIDLSEDLWDFRSGSLRIFYIEDLRSNFELPRLKITSTDIIIYSVA